MLNRRSTNNSKIDLELILSVKQYENGPRTADGLHQVYIYLNTPNKTLEWDVYEALTGHGISVSAQLLEPYVSNTHSPPTTATKAFF